MKLMVSAGGTGGHIFPGIAVAEAFMERDEKNEVLFVGTTQGMEGTIVPRHGFRLLFIEAHQFLGTTILHKAGALIGLARGIRTAMEILKREKPDAVIGTGGFTCVPTILAGVLLGIPSFLHEQNVKPGLANKLLSRFAHWTFVSFDETRAYLSTKKVSRSGNPLRKVLRAWPEEKPKDTFALFIFGGSRGAHSINQAVLSLLPYLKSYRNMVMYHQTGKDDFAEVKAAYEAIGIPHEVFPFTDRMERYYTLSDVAVSRAGASTIFELSFFKRPAVLIPYPFAAGGHQSLNASVVEQLGGGYVVEDKEATGERLHAILKGLIEEPGRVKAMGEKMGGIYVADAAERIVRHIYDHCTKGHPR